MTKAQLRHLMRSRRAEFVTTHRDVATAQLHARLKYFLVQEKVPISTTVAVYLAKGDEASIDETARWLLEAGYTVVAPCGDTFATLQWNCFQFSEFGVREPASWNGGRTVAAELIDVFLVPGLAFDETGHRLGQGGGWYDKALERAQHSLRIGVAFDVQIVKEVPQEAHDCTMQVVVTESRIIFAESRC
jgi:5-formyltetrahydrofolate cyclo-ligase